MRVLMAVAISLLTTGCVSAFTDYKSRSYGDHKLNEGQLITMSSTFRTGRLATTAEKYKVLCLDPPSEVAVLLAGSSKLALPFLGGGATQIDDGAVASATKAHEAAAAVQVAGLAYSISCNDWINGARSAATHEAAVSSIIDALVVAIAKPAEPAKVAPAVVGPGVVGGGVPAAPAPGK